MALLLWAAGAGLGVAGTAGAALAAWEGAAGAAGVAAVGRAGVSGVEADAEEVAAAGLGCVQRFCGQHGLPYAHLCTYAPNL